MADFLCRRGLLENVSLGLHETVFVVDKTLALVVDDFSQVSEFFLGFAQHWHGPS